MLTESWLNVPIVCLSQIYLKENNLFYQKNGVEFQIERIYNRLVYDELMQQSNDFKNQFRYVYSRA